MSSAAFDCQSLSAFVLIPASLPEESRHEDCVFCQEMTEDTAGLRVTEREYVIFQAGPHTPARQKFPGCWSMKIKMPQTQIRRPAPLPP
ncbi:hypothetical protein [Azohydromonas lata]|uniref:hypothetical protein n=1 Tax=Azohydromonas lata TaxID=45677 RepID=UPI0012F4F762|nr:hypothetical protein [Azohydromonas lata]